MSKKGIAVVDGVVFRNGLDLFKADKDVISESMSYISKISKGLHSGSLNSDPEFIKFQQSSMDNLINLETDKLAKKVSLRAEEQFKKLRKKTQKVKSDSFVYAKSANKPVTPIEIDMDDDVKNKRKARQDSIAGMIDDQGKKISSFSDELIERIKKINKKNAKKGKKGKKGSVSINNTIKVKKKAEKKAKKKGKK